MDDLKTVKIKRAPPVRAGALSGRNYRFHAANDNGPGLICIVAANNGDRKL